jgi:hypothetical protein
VFVNSSDRAAQSTQEGAASGTGRLPKRTGRTQQSHQLDDEQALTLGRAYANLTRAHKGVTIYDEMAVMNDLNAATAGAVASPVQAPVGTVEERLAKLDDLRARSIISDVEFAERRQKILDEI